MINLMFYTKRLSQANYTLLQRDAFVKYLSSTLFRDGEHNEVKRDLLNEIKNLCIKLVI